ncbi:MAG: class III signal peptide-containing protein [Methanosphaera sp.]|nr:class III signal peptide-containing protein [Methanosphaera sp.]
MINDNKAQTSVELMLILASMMIIVLVCGNFMIDSLNDIVLHIKIVIRNIRNTMINNV